MAAKVGFYYKTGGVETGGTNALTGLVSGGTLISSADANTTPFSFDAYDTVYTLYYRTIDDVTEDDAGKDTSSTFTITPPFPNIQLCTTYNGTFGNTATVAAATGAYKPVYAKQVSGVSGSVWTSGATYSANDIVAIEATPSALYVCTGNHTAGATFAGDKATYWTAKDMEVGTGSVTFTAGTRVAQAGTITLTPSSGGLVADLADVASADGYQFDISTASDFATYARSYTSASTQTFTGLTNGTTYYVRCRAWDERGVGAFSATASKAAGYTFTDAFSTLDTDRWGTAVAGSGTAGVTAGELVLDSYGSTSDAAICYLKQAIPAETLTYRHKVKFTRSGNAGTAYHALAVRGEVPDCDTNTNVNAAVLITVNIGDDRAADANSFYQVHYFDTSGVVQRWNGSSFTTTNAENSGGLYLKYDTYCFVELQVTSTQWRVVIYQENGTTVITTTSWVNWSSTRSATDKYISWGDPYSNAIWNLTCKSDSFQVS